MSKPIKFTLPKQEKIHETKKKLFERQYEPEQRLALLEEALLAIVDSKELSADVQNYLAALRVRRS